jgi:hypothetical protein
MILATYYKHQYGNYDAWMEDMILLLLLFRHVLFKYHNIILYFLRFIIIRLNCVCTSRWLGYFGIVFS